MSDSALRRQLQDRLLAVEERLTAACHRCGRARPDVTLVAVTKTISPQLAALLPDVGVIDLGESRPQELWRKAAVLSSVRWHMIGHLQSNKIERTLPLTHLIHGVDSVRLLHALDAEAGRQQRTIAVLLQFNTSDEASKHGFAVADVDELADVIPTLTHVHVRGLMTMAAFQEAEACRPCFSLLRQVRDRLRSRLAEPHILEHLSMGMTNDFEIAVEEGATLVRLGTILFDGLAT